jgi:hypothetical protein
MQNNIAIMIGRICSMHGKIRAKTSKFWLQNFNVGEGAVNVGVDGRKIPYFTIDNAHLMYKAHPKLFRHSFWCIDNAHDAN